MTNTCKEKLDRAEQMMHEARKTLREARDCEPGLDADDRDAITSAVGALGAAAEVIRGLIIINK